MIDTTDNNRDVPQEQQQEEGKKQFLSSGDRDFIQTFCVDAIRLKRQERVQTKAAKASQEEAKQEEELKAEDNEGDMLA